jgi:hypothetical protein
MSLGGFLLLLAGLSLSVGLPAWLYLRREFPVPQRLGLAAHRAGVLTLIVLLLWNPEVPGWRASEAGNVPGILLDASLSMGAGSPSPWNRALEGIELGPVALFGERVRTVQFGAESAPGDPEGRGGPSDQTTLLAPALRRVAALGAREVRVVSDFRIEDPAEVRQVLAETGLGVEAVDLGGSLVNGGIAELEVPGSVPASDSVTVEVTWFGEGLDSVSLAVSVEGELRASVSAGVPSPGRLARTRLSFPAPPDSGRFVLTARVEAPGDTFQGDDVAREVLRVGPSRGGVVLVSTGAGWEGRYLLPVISRATGLNGTGFMALGESRFLRMGGPGGPPSAVSADEVREAASRAELLVVVGADSQAALTDVVHAASTPLLFVEPSQDVLSSLGLSAARPLEGEWFPSPDLPSSPVAPILVGADLAGLPPLSAPAQLQGEVVGISVLLAGRQGRAGTAPVVLLLPGPRPRAVALAGGFWRWAAREGAPRDAYRRLWGGVAGWLLGGGDLASPQVLRPARSVVGPGTAIEWIGPPGVADSLSLFLRDSVGQVAEARLEGGSAGTPLQSGPLGPGVYTYEARRLSSEAGIPEQDPEIAGTPAGAEAPSETLSVGVIVVEQRTRDLLAQRQDPSQLFEADSRRLLSDSGVGRPLREHPAPYLLGILLLCSEWVLRRRKGLR